MTQYQSRRAVVEAMQFTASRRVAIKEWIDAAAGAPFVAVTSQAFSILVGDDMITAAPNDMIVRLGEGEYEVLSPKAFAAKYEPFAESPESYERVHSTEEAREMVLNQGVDGPKKETKE